MLDVAIKEQADLSVIERELEEFAGLIDGNEELRRALLNPAVPAPRKRAAVVDLAALAALNGILARTLILLAERDRLAILPDFVEAFRRRLLDLRNVVRAEVTTAMPIEPERLQDIQRSLAAATGRTVELTAKVDPSLVGGMVAKVGGTVFDGSVVNHLDRLRQRLEASL